MALEGTLYDMPLSDLLHVCGLGAKSGVLRLHANQQHGTMFFWQGTLLDAMIVCSHEHKPTACSDEAVLTMLTWKDAAFIFEHNPATEQFPRRMVHDREWLVLEGLRRGSVPVSVGEMTLDTQFQLATPALHGDHDIHLDILHWRILNMFASPNTIRAACVTTGIAPEKAITLATELAAIGMIEPVRARAVRPRPRAAERNAPRAGLSGSQQRTGPARRKLVDAIMQRIQTL